VKRTRGKEGRRGGGRGGKGRVRGVKGWVGGEGLREEGGVKLEEGGREESVRMCSGAQKGRG